MAEIEIGLGKSARQAYRLDQISIVPTRRTRDARDVSISWEIDAYKFDIPAIAEARNNTMSPAAVVAVNRLGACGVLDLAGLWTRYETPETHVDELATLSDDKASLRLAELYEVPISDDLIKQRVHEIKQSGTIVTASLPPHLVQQHASALGELDMLVIKSSVFSAENVSKTAQSLDLKAFVREFSLPVIVGDCASYHAALHLMRTGAAGVLIGSTDDGTGVGVPQATAIADARAARMRNLDETGMYCHVIADGQMRSAADIAKAVVCGADAVMIDSEITDESFDLVRTSMAITGYESLKDFQKAEIVINNTIGELQ